MWIYLTIPAILATLYLIRRSRITSKRQLIREIQIGTVDGYYYNIEVNTLQHQKNPTEAKRLTLGFLVAILRYTQKHYPTEFQDILKFLREVSREDLSADNINAYFLREFAFELIVRNEAVESKGKIIRGKYYSLTGNKRQFVADIAGGNFKYQFLFSVGSLMNSLANYLDHEQRERFRIALLHILKTLDNATGKAVSEKLKTLENEAWMAANQAAPPKTKSHSA